MGFRTGFGVVKGLVSASNPKLVVVIKNQQRSHITSITAGFVLEAGSTAPTSFDAAAVQVLNGRFNDDIDDTPDPEQVDAWAIASLQNSSQQSICLWEARFAGTLDRHWYFGDRGIVLEPQTDYAVILSAPCVDGAPLPSGIGDDYVSFLSVNGWVEDRENPFKKLNTLQNV